MNISVCFFFLEMCGVIERTFCMASFMLEGYVSPAYDLSLALFHTEGSYHGCL